MTANPSMPCKDINELCPTLKRGAEEFLKRCEKAGLKVLITQTYRSSAYQNSLYQQGRTTKGSIVTNLNGTTNPSPHQFRIAFDICKNVKGQEWSDNNFFKQCGKIWVDMGGVWGGNWTSFVDMPHFEFTDGKGCTPFKAGYKFYDEYRMPWELTKKESEEVLGEMKLDFKGKSYTIPSVLKDGANYPNLRELAKVLSLTVGYNDATKTVTLK